MADMRFLVACLVLLVHYSCEALAVGNTTVKCRVKERLSLLSLKRGFVDPRGCLSSWRSSENHTDCCTWYGVLCDSQTGHVDSLRLDQCNLEGTISPSLAELHHLKYLDLGFQNFSPTKFPDSILSLKRLQSLDLSFTNLTGNIPFNLGYLSRLQILDLQGNHLEGGIPKSLALCNLIDLDLFDNSLSGQLDDFVASFDHCANISLQNLDLSYNRFTGSVPNFSRFSFLERLYLSNNQLNGTVNDGIGLLSKLQFLDITNNFLHGVITETHFSRLSQLESLGLSLNNLEFRISPDWIPPFQLADIDLRSCKLGPGFPNWLRTQKSGSSLDISNAEISSTMPSWFWDLSFKSMNLSHNQMTGEIQNFQLGNGSLAMNLDLSSNLFEGSIPSNLSHTALALFLSDNKFTDASTFLCPNETVVLEILDLSNNQLSGVLPDCWKYFESLALLDVANNSLYGEIPTSMGSLINIQSLHLGFNKFSGEIPLSLNKCTELVDFDAVENDFKGLVPRWIGDGLKGLSILILRSNMFFGSLPLKSNKF
ncbi:receptor-like protein EIX2 [Neltuma alba]|uniref:receptor-like protein EIX2 n=1 Tax=Neltuma alba TaxID=207710 RepID=UPI0010A30B74|nr:receptor-like protein EIX2 [Prosopis alba]